MPRDVRGAPVERYKITPEMQGVLKRYKQLKKVEGMLRYGTEIEKRKFESLREMWRSLQAEAERMEKGMPRESLRELEGMDFPSREKFSEEDVQLRY